MQAAWLAVTGESLTNAQDKVQVRAALVGTHPRKPPQASSPCGSRHPPRGTPFPCVSYTRLYQQPKPSASHLDFLCLLPRLSTSRTSEDLGPVANAKGREKE